MITSLPTVKAPYQSNFAPSSLSSMETNDHNARVEVVEKDDYWTGELRYKNLDAEQVRQFFNFMAKMRGPTNEFFYLDHKHQQLGTWTGTPRVKGGLQDGRELLVDGLAGGTTVAPEGDRFQLGDHLYHLTSDVITDNSGAVFLEFIPELRIIPADNTPLIVINPACKCMLLPNQPPPVTRGFELLSEWGFKFRESIR